MLTVTFVQKSARKKRFASVCNYMHYIGRCQCNFRLRKAEVRGGRNKARFIHRDVQFLLPRPEAVSRKHGSAVRLKEEDRDHGPEPAQGDRRGGIVVNEEGLTSREAVYAGGDAVTGAATVISAMGAGKLAAASIDEYLSAK